MLSCRTEEGARLELEGGGHGREERPWVATSVGEEEGRLEQAIAWRVREREGAVNPAIYRAEALDMPASVKWVVHATMATLDGEF